MRTAHLPPERLTNSRRKDRQECESLEYFGYQERYRSPQNGPAARWGSAFHKACEIHASGGAFTWDSLFPEFDLDATQQAQVRVMFECYLEHWGPHQDVESVEDSIEAPLRHPDTGATHTRFRLAGKLDMVTSVPGGVVLWDHKTTSADFGPGSSYVRALEIDTQVSHYYVLAAAQGWHVTAWVHDIVARPQCSPLQATPRDKWRFKKRTKAQADPASPEFIEDPHDERLLYASVRTESESIDEYAARLRAKVQAEPDKYFRRVTVTRTPEEIDAHVRDLWTLADDWFERPPVRNPAACFRWGECPYFVCCTTDTSPADYPSRFVRMNTAHPELEPTT